MARSRKYGVGGWLWLNIVGVLVSRPALIVEVGCKIREGELGVGMGVLMLVGERGAG